MHGRTELDTFLDEAKTAKAVIVCSGAPGAFLDLPARTDDPVVIDVGVPAQVRTAPGWTALTLDELLTRPAAASTTTRAA